MKRNIISLITIIMIILLCSSNNVYALGNIVDAGEGFLDKGKSEFDANVPIDEGKMQQTSKNISGIFFVLGLVLAIGVGIVIGIQFIVGSVDEKAKIKETLVPYVIGCVVLFSAFTIWRIVIEVGSNMENASINYSNEISNSTIV